MVVEPRAICPTFFKKLIFNLGILLPTFDRVGSTGEYSLYQVTPRELCPIGICVPAARITSYKILCSRFSLLVYICSVLYFFFSPGTYPPWVLLEESHCKWKYGPIYSRTSRCCAVHLGSISMPGKPSPSRGKVDSNIDIPLQNVHNMYYIFVC